MNRVTCAYLILCDNSRSLFRTIFGKNDNIECAPTHSVECTGCYTWDEIWILIYLIGWTVAVLFRFVLFLVHVLFAVSACTSTSSVRCHTGDTVNIPIKNICFNIIFVTLIFSNLLALGEVIRCQSLSSVVNTFLSRPSSFQIYFSIVKMNSNTWTGQVTGSLHVNLDKRIHICYKRLFTCLKLYLKNFLHWIS